MDAYHDGQHRFAAALQAALTTADVSAAFLANAGHLIRSGGFGMYRLDFAGGVLSVDARVEVDFLEDYESYGRGDDPVLRYVLAERRVIDSSRVVGTTEWEKCGARSALAVGGYYHSLEAPVVASGVLYGTINFARKSDEPAFSEADLISVRAASEQLGLAIERALRFEATGQRASVYEHALDRLPHSIILSDLDARMLFANRAALAALAAGSAAFVSEAITEAVAGFRTRNQRVHTRAGRDRSTGRQVVVRSYRLAGQVGAVLTMVSTVDQSAAGRLPAWDVLSKREQEIAALVSEGLTNKQIAERTVVSENTVKQHLKRIFAKTGVRSRAELLQRIWTAAR